MYDVNNMDNQSAQPDKISSKFFAGQPNVFIPTTGAPPPQPPVPPVPLQDRKWLTPKNIFIVLGIVVAIELILAIKSVVSRSDQSGAVSSPAISQPFTSTPAKGTISLSSDQSQVKVGDTVSVSIEVTSPLPAAGVDVVARFDPNLLSAIDGDVRQGTIFPQYPLSKVEPSGLVRISGIAAPGAAGFSGKDIFATVNFKALKAGKASITLDFTPDQTADSNIVGPQNGKDLLEQVKNLEITIK